MRRRQTRSFTFTQQAPEDPQALLARWAAEKAANIERGQALRSTLKIGDELVVNHFGATRPMVVVKITKSRVGLRWVAPSSGIERVVFYTDVQLGDIKRVSPDVRKAIESKATDKIQTAYQQYSQRHDPLRAAVRIDPCGNVVKPTDPDYATAQEVK